MIVIKHQGNFFFVALASIDVDFCSMHRTFYWTLLLITSIIIDSIFLVLSTLQLSKFERQWTRIKTTWKCKANKDEPAKHQIYGNKGEKKFFFGTTMDREMENDTATNEWREPRRKKHVIFFHTFLWTPNYLEPKNSL